MSTQTLYYATNRNHLGRNRWKPQGYGTKFSDDGIENLRFGKVAVPVDDAQVTRFTSKTLEANGGVGEGEGLSGYLAGRVRKGSTIEAFEEVIDPDSSDVHQKGIKLGSQAMFAELKSLMMQATDVVIYIHGFNVSWNDAVATALALQSMLNTPDDGVVSQQVVVVLFTWPSDGMALPFVSYKSDRTEAEGTGYAFSASVSLLYTAQLTFPYHLRDIRRSRRVWVLSLTDTDENIIAAISSGCASSTVQSAPPFEMILLEDCPSL